MQKLIFDEYGKPARIAKKNAGQKKLKTSDSLEFLKRDNPKFNDIFERDYWSLYSGDKKLEPLKFSNGKTQEDVVKEIIDASKNHKVIFLHGTCGSGKSAIALNIARVLGKTSVVVPSKALQKQYEEDYLDKKYLLKKNKEKMKIAVVTGRNNHDSLIKPGISCADPSLPENIKITERNYPELISYAKKNPYLKNPANLDIKDIKRLTVAVANPYWSPIVPSDFEIKSLKNAQKQKYKGADKREYVFYHRKKGCSYYDQYLSYIYSDVIIFNSAKYKAELALGRKPLTEADIIDEADEFLDSFFRQDSLNLTILKASLKNINPSTLNSSYLLNKIKKLIELEEKNKKAIGIRKQDVFNISETKIKEIIDVLNLNPDLETEITMDEFNYANKALEIAKNFKNSLKDVYLTYEKDEEENLKINLVSSNLSGKFNELLEKSKTLILMSGTLHSENIIRKIFGINDFKVINAEELSFGSTEVLMTGKEFDCKYSNFFSKRYTRRDYLKALSDCLNKAETPVLVHVHSFKDLPSEKEKELFGVDNLKSFQELKNLQAKDKHGSAISEFKSGNINKLFSTKCGRGVDFPGEICNSIIFTKYPNPNVKDTFWKVLQKTHPDYYWEFYKDKARREFLQRIYRALRSPNDFVLVLSPDIRAINAVKKLQRNKIKK